MPISAERFSLLTCEFLSRLTGENQQFLQVFVAKRPTLRSPLKLYKPPGSRQDDVHIDFSLRIFGIVEVRHGNAVDDSDADRRDAVDNDFSDFQPLDRSNCIAESDEATGNAQGARSAVGLQDIAVDGDGIGPQSPHVDDGPQTAADQSLDLGRPSINTRAFRGDVLPGSMLYSAVTHPEGDSTFAFQGGTEESTLAVQRTTVSPALMSTLPGEEEV